MMFFFFTFYQDIVFFSLSPGYF